MLPDASIPERFTIRSDLGIFLMESVSYGVFEASANGFVLNIIIDRKAVGFHYSATLCVDSDKWDYATTDIQGDYQHIDDLIPFIASWMDHCASEAIEDFAKDVCYLETPKGRIAWWSYNTHLEGTPVVFVHGGPGGDSNPVKARRMHLDNPVYLYDQMGCGFSDPIKDLDSWTLQDYVNEISLFIDSIPSEKVILFGASWGSGLALAYAASSHCGKVKAMVLPSPFISSPAWAEDQFENLKAMGGDYYRRMMECIRDNDFSDKFYDVMGEYYARFLFNKAENREIALAAASEDLHPVFVKMWGPNDMVCTGTLKDFDLIPALKDLDIPVLFMCADSDEVTLERILSYKSMVRGSRLSVIPHAGHVLGMEQFESYRAATKAFFDENHL